MNDEQLLRYSRQILLPNIDIDGQQKLNDATVLIAGLGGLGCPAALYLAAAGVGRLVLVDHDDIDVTNLQRQVLYTTTDVGAPKAETAAAALCRLNPEIEIHSLATKVDEDVLGQWLPDAELVLDCTDNFSTRYLINRHCVAHQVALVSAAAIRWEGQLALFDPHNAGGGCYACLYPEQDMQEELSCSQTGILGPVVGTMGTLQALMAIRFLTGIGGAQAGQLLLFDGNSLEWTKLALSQRSNCPVCGES